MKGNFVLSLGLLLILVYIAFAEPSSDEGQALEPAAVGTVDDEIMMELNKAWGVYSWPAYPPEASVGEPLSDEEVEDDRIVLKGGVILTEQPAVNKKYAVMGTHCEWSGIKCGNLEENRGRVVEIKLNVKDIMGTIPAAIGGLEHLTQLYLFANMLEGTIPKEIGNLSKLTHISLGDNKLEGTLPVELAQLKELRFLYIFGNQISGTIPREYGKLSSLEHIGLWQNHLEGEIPAELGDLSKLSHIWLNYNKLSGTIPASIGSLKQMRNLYLSGNQVSGDLPDMSQLQQLEGLYIQFTNLTGSVPCDIASIPTFKNLEADESSIAGCHNVDCLRKECGLDALPHRERDLSAREQWSVPEDAPIDVEEQGQGISPTRSKRGEL